MRPEVRHHDLFSSTTCMSVKEDGMYDMIN